MPATVSAGPATCGDTMDLSSECIGHIHIHIIIYICIYIIDQKRIETCFSTVEFTVLSFELLHIYSCVVCIYIYILGYLWWCHDQSIVHMSIIYIYISNRSQEMRKLMIRMGSTQKLSTDNGISIWGYRKIGFGKLSMEQSLICFYI